MSKWISQKDLENTMGHKILIAGLQEAGKTAIKRVFFLRQQAVDVNGLKATIDYERLAVRINNVPITVVDLGGQRIFIRRFLSTFSPFIFNSVKIFIFVIDVSIKTTRNNAVQYFTAALEKLKEYSPNAEIYVFLHKNDLIRNSPNYESIHAQIKEEFQVGCEREIKFFRTTIFDEKSIINSLGRIFELSIPNAAKSKFVDNKVIGDGEEFSGKFAVDQFKDFQENICPFCNVQLFKTPNGFECNVCGYKPKGKQQKIDAEPIKPKISVDDLKAKLSSVKISQNEASSDISGGSTNVIPTKFSFSSISQSLSESNFNNNLEKILNLSFNKDEVEKKLSLDQKLFLNVCINIKLPVELTKFILNEYIVKYNPKKLKIYDYNILQAISYLKFGYLKDKDFLKYLFLTEYYQDVSVEETLWNNFPYPFKESYSAETEEDLEKLPLEKDLILLSFKENIGAKITNKDNNAEITFYKGKKRLGIITIPYSITPKDLKYMLIFELKFPIEKNLQGFVEETTTKLLTEMKNIRGSIKDELKPSTAEAIKTETKQSTEIRLTENKEIYYKIILNKPNFEVAFKFENKDFGKIIGPDSISASGLYQLVKNETLIPSLIGEDELMFATLEMYNKFNQLNK